MPACFFPSLKHHNRVNRRLERLAQGTSGTPGTTGPIAMRKLEVFAETGVIHRDGGTEPLFRFGNRPVVTVATLGHRRED